MSCIRLCTAILAAIAGALLLSACSSELDSEATAVSALAQPRPGPSAHYYPPAPVDESSPSQVHAELIRWFSKAGYKDFQVTALAEHAKIESGFRPCASGPGLRYTYQWGGLRLRRLNEFAGARGGCPPLDKQLAFADNELRNESSYSCFWQATTKSAALAALRRGFGGGNC
jgi:hypothetical protein